jgi:peptidyl-prolyl cis-trans isomerase SurA
VFAVCSKEPTRGDSPEERAAREEISNQRYEAQSKRYLEELRRSAMIEIR